MEEDSRTGKVTNMFPLVKSSVDVFCRLDWNVLHIYIYIYYLLKKEHMRLSIIENNRFDLVHV